MKIKKFISLILALVMLLSFGVQTASAENEVFSEMRALKLLPQEITEGNSGELITREIFAYMTAKMMSQSEMPAAPTSFADVSEENKYSGYIKYLTDSGVVSGDGEGNFNPHGNVTMSAAYKIIVTLLGYKTLAESRGGFPDGYENIGIDLKLYDNVSTEGGFLTNGGAVNMISNALRAEMASGEHIVGEDGTVNIVGKDKEKTILSDILGISIYSGFVESVNLSRSSLSFTVAKSKNSTNGIVLNAGETVTLGYSQSVNAAAYKYAPVTVMIDEDETIVGMTLAKNTEVLVGCISSVNGNSDEDTQPYNPDGIERITMLDNEAEYDVADDVNVYLNEKIASEPVKLTGQPARVILEDGVVVSVETWDLTEGGIITGISESELVYTKGENSGLKLKDIDTFKNKYIYIDGRSAQDTEIKTNSVFCYYAGGDTLVLVISERIAVDSFYSAGAQTLEIGGFIYSKGNNIYYKTDDSGFKQNGDYVPLLGKLVKAYIAPNGKVLYVEAMTGAAKNENIFMGLVKGYEKDSLDEEVLYLKVLRFHPEISEGYYNITEKTVFSDSVTREIIMQNAGKIGSDYVYEFEINTDGKIKSVKKASWLFGYGERTERTISSFVNDGTAMMTVNKKALFFRNVPLTFVYENNDGITAQNVAWSSVYGKSCTATAAFFTFDGNEQSSVPDLVFIYGAGLESLGSRVIKLGVVSKKEQAVDENGELCVLITVQTGSATFTYNVSAETAKTLSERMYITYYDSMMFADEEISITNRIDLSGDPSTWSYVTGYAAEGLHKGTVEKIDSIRMITKEEDGTIDANYFHPSFNFFVEIDESTPNNPVRNITASDITYGDTVFFNVTGDGIRGVIVVR